MYWIKIASIIDAIQTSEGKIWIVSSKVRTYHERTTNQNAWTWVRDIHMTNRDYDTPTERTRFHVGRTFVLRWTILQTVHWMRLTETVPKMTLTDHKEIKVEQCSEEWVHLLILKLILFRNQLFCEIRSFITPCTKLIVLCNNFSCLHSLITKNLVKSLDFIWSLVRLFDDRRCSIPQICIAPYCIMVILKLNDSYFHLFKVWFKFEFWQPFCGVIRVYFLWIHVEITCI